jgi:uncharacterized protein
MTLILAKLAISARSRTLTNDQVWSNTWWIAIPQYFIVEKREMTYRPISLWLAGIFMLFVPIACGPANIPFTASTAVAGLPQPVGYVNDFEGILSRSEERKLTSMIVGHEERTTDQIAVVTVSSTGVYQGLEDYAFVLMSSWGVGAKGKYNGVMVVLGKELRKVRIETGRGIVERLTDQEAQDIIDGIMIPAFRKDDFYSGLKNGIEEMIGELN